MVELYCNTPRCIVTRRERKRCHDTIVCIVTGCMLAEEAGTVSQYTSVYYDQGSKEQGLGCVATRPAKPRHSSQARGHTPCDTAAWPATRPPSLRHGQVAKPRHSATRPRTRAWARLCAQTGSSWVHYAPDSVLT